MTRFRPCIDLHAGQVKQIVGGTLDSKTAALQTNFVSPHPPAHFAKLYRDNALAGAHVIMLGSGNTDAARESLAAWPGGLQVGGGIHDGNAKEWIEAGAERVGSPVSVPIHGMTRSTNDPPRSSSPPSSFPTALSPSLAWTRSSPRWTVTRASW